jgi:hypothetical protein
LRAHISSVAHTIDQIERHQPAVLNAIASVNGTVRILRRELEAVAQIAGASDETGALMSSSRELQETTRRLTLELERIRQRTDDAHAAIADVYNHIRRIQQETATGDANVLAEVRPHLDTLSWLVGRVEVVRAEVMNELRYGGGADAGADAGRGRGARPGDVGSQPPKVVNAAAMSPADGDLRVNLGAGHIPLDGFVNVDIREIPGIDVVASVDDCRSRTAPSPRSSARTRSSTSRKRSCGDACCRTGPGCSGRAARSAPSSRHGGDDEGVLDGHHAVRHSAQRRLRRPGVRRRLPLHRLHSRVAVGAPRGWRPGGRDDRRTGARER